MKTFREHRQRLDEIERIDFDVSKKEGAERLHRNEVEKDIVKRKGQYYYGFEKDSSGGHAFVGEYNKHRKNEFVKLGYIDLEQVGSNRYTVELASLSGRSRGKGIGKGLYDFILTDMKFILVSGSSQSIGGRKVWKYLAGNRRYIVWAQPSLTSKKRIHVDVDPDEFEVDSTGNFTVYSGEDEREELEQDYSEAIHGLKAIQNQMSKTEYNKRMKRIHKDYEDELKDASKGRRAFLFATAKKHFRK